MNAVIYKLITHKKINGTLFYAYEYYSLLKQSIPDLKFVLFNATHQDLMYVKEVLSDKYNTNDKCLDDMISVSRYTDVMMLKVKLGMILDVDSYTTLKPFLPNSRLLVYSNDVHDFLNKNKHHTFYGWYDYQNFNKKTRLKIFADIHRTYKQSADKFLFTSPEGGPDLLNLIKEDKSQVLVKSDHSVFEGLFSLINKVVYFHNGKQDTNNRLIPESAIHGKELVVYLNNNLNDSIYDRYTLVKEGRVNELLLTKDDIMIQDFIKAYNE